MEEQKAGFKEVEHTADLELEVWGETVSALFHQAARGMRHLLDVQVDSSARATRQFNVKAIDYEGLLVDFLSELLYLLERDGLVFQNLALDLTQGTQLEVEFQGVHVESYSREIKAVTYHNLEVKQTEEGWTANVVFDI